MKNHVTVNVTANTSSYDAAMERSINRHIQPLGRITGKASEFQKSLEASHARVLAFGASAGAIYTLKRAFDFTVGSMIDVEKALIDINTLLGLNTQDLARFGSNLFATAIKTATSFKDASVAAAEFSRQGLSVEETLIRTEVALGITRLSGLELTESISSLTAAMNTFNKEGLTAIQFADKLATVDARFAVSSGDLAQAIKRVGSTAEDANVSLDEMLAVVTATQQKTARGGAIIGNAFKTIFTRLQRPQVIAQLEQLGIKTREITGEVLPLMTILKQLAQGFDELAPSVRAQTAELVGGVFQVNVLKAAMSDLGSGFSVYDSALKVAGNSTGEFNRRNEELNQTLSAKLAQTLAISTSLFAKLGEITLKPIVSGGVGSLKKLATDLNDILTTSQEFDPKTNKITQEAQGMGGEVGHTFAVGFLGGIGSVLSGPGIQIVATILTKLAIDFTKFFRDSTRDLTGLTTNASRYKQTYEGITAHLKTHPELLSRISDGTMSIAQIQRTVLDSIKLNNAALAETDRLTRSIASNQTGYNPNRPSIASKAASAISSVRGPKTFAAGFNPLFALEEMKAIGLGASKNVKAHMSKGTINGEKFVMNNGEKEIVGAGANGDSAVIPSYGPGVLKKKKWYEVYNEKKRDAIKKHKTVTQFKNEKFARDNGETLKELFDFLGASKGGFAGGHMPSNPMSLAEGFSPMGGMGGGGGGDIMTSILIGMAGSFGGSMTKMAQDLDGTTAKLTGFQDAIDAAKDTLSQLTSLENDRQTELTNADYSTGDSIQRVKDKIPANIKAANEGIDKNTEQRLEAAGRKKTSSVGAAIRGRVYETDLIDKQISFKDTQIFSAKAAMDKDKKDSLSKADAETQAEFEAARKTKENKISQIEEDKKSKLTSADSSISVSQQNINLANSRLAAISQDPVTKRFNKLTPEQKVKAAKLRDFIKSNKASIEVSKTRKEDAIKEAFVDERKTETQYESDKGDIGKRGETRKSTAMSDFEKRTVSTSAFISQQEAEKEALKKKKRDVRVGAIEQVRNARREHKDSIKNIPIEGEAKKVEYGKKIQAAAQSNIDALQARAAAVRKDTEEEIKQITLLKKQTQAKKKADEENLKALSEETERITARDQKVQSRAMMASIGLSFASGSGIPKAVGDAMGGEQMGNVTQEAAQSLTTSAQILTALPGSLGQLAAGAYFLGKTLFSVGSNFFGSAKRVAELEVGLEILKESVSRSNSAINEYTQLLSPIKDAYYSNTVTTKQLSEMQHRAAVALSKVPAELRDKISVATTEKEKTDLLGNAQETNYRKQREQETELGLQKRVKAGEDRNLTSGILGSIGTLGAAPLLAKLGVPGFKEMDNNSSAFTTTNVFGGRSKTQEKTDNSDLSSFVSTVIGGMDESTAKKSIAVLSTKKARLGTAKENLGDLAAAGAISSETAGSLNDEEAQKFVTQFRKQTIDTEASKLAVAQIDKLRKEDIKNMQSLNRELDIMNQIQKSTLSDMNRGMNNFIKGVNSAASNLSKLDSAKRDAQMDEVGTRTELAGLQYGAQTMNRIKGEGEKQKILTSSGNQLAELKTATGNSAADEIMKSVLSKSDTSVKNSDGSEYTSEDSLVAKNKIREMVNEQKQSGVTNPQEMLENIRKKTEAVEVLDKDGNIDAAKTENLKSQIKLGIEDNGMKDRLNDIAEGQREQTETIKTNAKIATDKADANIKAQERLIEAQRNARLFGNLPANKQEQKLLEKQIKSDSRKSNKGDIYASNRLLALTNGQFGDSLEESSVADLKGKVKEGEFARQRKIVGAFDKGGAVSGIRNQFSDARLRTISSDKVNSLLKTENKGLDTKKFVGGSMSEELVESNKSLMRGLRSLEETFRNTVSATGVDMSPDLKAIADKEKQLNADRLAVKGRQEALSKEREKDFNIMKKAFSEALKGGFTTNVEHGGVNVLVDGTQGLSEEVAEAVRNGVAEMIKNEVAYRFGQRAGAPAEAGR